MSKPRGGLPDCHTQVLSLDGGRFALATDGVPGSRLRRDDTNQVALMAPLDRFAREASDAVNHGGPFVPLVEVLALGCATLMPWLSYRLSRRSRGSTGRSAAAQWTAAVVSSCALVPLVVGIAGSTVGLLATTAALNLPERCMDKANIARVGTEDASRAWQVGLFASIELLLWVAAPLVALTRRASALSLVALPACVLVLSAFDIASLEIRASEVRKSATGAEGLVGRVALPRLDEPTVALPDVPRVWIPRAGPALYDDTRGRASPTLLTSSDIAPPAKDGEGATLVALAIDRDAPFGDVVRATTALRSAGHHRFAVVGVDEHGTPVAVPLSGFWSWESGQKIWGSAVLLDDDDIEVWQSGAMRPECRPLRVAGRLEPRSGTDCTQWPPRRTSIVAAPGRRWQDVMDAAAMASNPDLAATGNEVEIVTTGPTWDAKAVRAALREERGLAGLGCGLRGNSVRVPSGPLARL